MKKIAVTIYFICAWANAHAQINFVKNPDLETYTTCPDYLNQIIYCKYWSIPKDSTTTSDYSMEYYNACGNAFLDHGSHVPANTGFYQYPHSGNGMAGAVMYYDKTAPHPASPIPFNYRDYLQGHLYQPLTAGKTYCISFWVNCTEGAGYAQNKIGAYLDNGAINTLPIPVATEITSVTPQVYTNTVIKDTANWTKIEGSFVATGNETYITIGNFFTNAATDTLVTNYWFGAYQYSYYLIDDVSVIPIDSPARAGADVWVEETKSVQIGRVGDSTAKGLDCKWYHKGMLIDSGAIVSVHAAATKGIVDTYVVVQTICGIVTTDTVNVWTVPLGITSPSPLERDGVRFYPNPSDGNIIITKSEANNNAISVKVFDLLGRVLQQQQLLFTNNQSNLKIEASSGIYILELQDNKGNVSRVRIQIE